MANQFRSHDDDSHSCRDLSSVPGAHSCLEELLMLRIADLEDPGVLGLGESFLVQNRCAGSS